MIPVSRCNIHSKSHGYKCPENFTCQDTKHMTKWTIQTYFIHTGVGLLTVYEAQTQEGWTKVMYETIDSSSDLGAVIYFIILIMFVAWLTKNIFIAIVTEVFADLRSQVHNLYNVPKSNLSKDSSKVLMYHKSETGLQLIQGDQFEKEAGCRLTFKTVVRSYIFTWFFVSCILVDALLQGVLDTGDRITSQIIFTVLFDIEVLIKITAFGAKVYFENVPHRFECLLAVGSTVFLIPLRLKYENYGPYALFNVMRPFRLVLAWPSLAYFLKRILGGGKKLGSLLLFTGIFIVVASGVSLQLFCNMKPGSGDLFETFPSAAKVMFQVLMQEAWNEVLHEMIRKSDNNYSALVFIYFILYHMFAAVILISVFVALILDNLEFDEEVKIMKQHHIKEVTDINYKMPLRLQIFQKMKARPKIVRTENIGCSIPKVRDSFMSHYLRDVTDDNVLYDTNITSKVNDVQPGDLGVNLISIQADVASIYPNKQLRKQSSVSALIHMSHHRKCILDGSANPLNPRIHHGRRGSTIRRRRFSHPHSFGGSLIQKANQGQNLDGGALPRRNILPYRFQLNSASDGKTEKNLDTVRQRLREAQRSKEAKLSDLRENFPYFDKSIFLLPYDNKIRKIFRHIVHARYVAFSESSEQRLFGAFSLNRFKKYLGSQTYLDWIMMLLTHISCWALLFETPEYRAFQYPPTKYVEYIFVVTTTLEIGLKSLADGFFLTPTALLKDFGGVLHFFIYIVALVHVCWHPQSIKPNSFAQMLLILRALRPLRIITLAPPLRNVVQIFVRGYKDILKVAILQLLLMFVFAIYGVQMFRNRLGYCTDSNLTTKRDCNGTCTVALSSPSGMTNIVGPKIKLDVPCVWRNPRNFNFDKLQNAFLALFEVLSLEGWTEVRNILQERVGSYASLYLHVYVFLACLIGLTLFIGVVVSNFNENKGTALLTVDQRRWQDLKKRLKLSQPIHMPPRPEDNDKIGYIYDFFQTKLYRILYVSVVALNGLTLVTAEWYPFSFNAYENGNDKYLLTPFTATAIAFVYLFVIDLAVKIVCYGFLGYWLSWRNRFDFVLTVFGVLWSIFHIMAYWSKSVQPITLQTGVVLIIFRLFTLAGKIESIRMIILTLGMSLYKSFYTISVLFVIMWCYALIGVIMFGSTRFGIALNRHANFRNSWYALLLLFRITTGEDWNRVMHDCMVSPPLCSLNEGDNYWETDCGHSIVAPIFFFSYYVIVTYIFLNLFIAVVIENFSLFSSTDDDMFMSDSDIKVFQEVWNIIDKDHSGKLRASLAKRVLGLSIAKLKFNISADRFLYKRMCAEVDRISNGKEVSFHDLLLVLAYNDSRVKISRNLQLAERLAREDQVRAITEEVAAQTIRVWCLRMWRGKSQNRTNRANMLSSKQSGEKLFDISACSVQFS